MAIDPIGGPSRGGAASAIERDESPSGGSALERLANQPSSLDRLVSDAGALGKFRTDQTDAMPSGASSFTVPISQTISHVEAKLGAPHERVLGATQVQPQREAVQAMRQSDATHLGLPPHAARTQQVAPRADVRTDTDNCATIILGGNPKPAGA